MNKYWSINTENWQFNCDRWRHGAFMSHFSSTCLIFTYTSMSMPFFNLWCSLCPWKQQEIYCPPLTIRVVDCRSFGRFTLVGTHVINSIHKFLYQPITKRDREAEEKRQAQLALKARLRQAQGEFGCMFVCSCLFFKAFVYKRPMQKLRKITVLTTSYMFVNCVVDIETSLAIQTWHDIPYFNTPRWKEMWWPVLPQIILLRKEG